MHDFPLANSGYFINFGTLIPALSAMHDLFSTLKRCQVHVHLQQSLLIALHLPGLERKAA